MGLRGVFILLILLLCLAAIPAHAQVAPSEQLTLTAKSAATWTVGQDNVVQLHGPVHIELDRAILSADDAVIWLKPASADNLEIQDAQIALIGHAKLEQPGVKREGGELFVTDQVRGDKIRIVADERVARDDSKSDLFQHASSLRSAELPKIAPAQVRPAATQGAGGTPGHPAVRPQTRPAPAKAFEAPVVFEAEDVESVHTDDGTVAVVLKRGVRLYQQRPEGDIIELSADTAVLFTPLKSLKELQQTGGKKQGRDLITSAYLEGDVRIDYLGSKKNVPEQRLSADRAFYEFGTDRAILTDAIIHTIQPKTGTPIVARAKVVRQLSNGEYDTEKVRLTNSLFAIPSYSIAADRLYLRSEPTGDPQIGDRITYDAYNATFQAFDLPFFFLPHTAGEMTEHGLALRGIGGGHDNNYGTFGETVWGLFETFGKIPPRDLDVNYRLDYFSARGPAFGVNAKYGGDLITDTSRQPWDFEGEFKSYFVYDKGVDDVGRLPAHVDDSQSLRGQILWEHQHFFPDGWQAQTRLGYVSDSTFMEQWFRRDFEQGDPHDVSGYIKHQRDTEAFTLGVVYQPNKLVTTSDFQQEQFEVERLPSIGYYREGDALFDDKTTFYSENTGVGLHYARSRDSLAEQGFAPAGGISPGFPAEGYTGLTGQVIWRGDMRQQLDFPFTYGALRVDPYVMGRFTEYSNSPEGNDRSRLMAGAGTRITTQLWKTDPAANSDFLDIHQLRHVIQPEANFFTSAMNVQRNQVFVYDPEVDAINDVSGAQFALHQRWETKRGGPGAWRSVDLFTLNVEVDAFVNKPAKVFNSPTSFRGLFFSSYPEESVPRDAVNADASWRFSDNTVLLGDMSYNLDRGSLQTLAIGMLIRRDQNLSYFVGNRYVAELHSNITSISVNYQLTTKYLLALDQEFDFTQGKNVYSSAAIIRRFDTFYMAFRYNFDETTNQNGISFNLYPVGLGQGLDTGALNTFHK